MANGVVALYDLSKLSEHSQKSDPNHKADSGPLVCRSEISEFFHIDRVTSLEWVQYKLNKAIETLLVSGSLDGKLLIWDALGNKLKYPKRGLIISAKSASAGLTSHFSGRLLLMQLCLCDRNTPRRTGSLLLATLAKFGGSKLLLSSRMVFIGVFWPILELNSSGAKTLSTSCPISEREEKLLVLRPKWRELCRMDNLSERPS